MQNRKLHTSRDYWEERANKVLSHFTYKYPDEIDLYDICWRYGIRIKPLDPHYVEGYETIKHLKAFSVPSFKQRRGKIYLKPGLDGIEKKLLLAEEFCHLYSHFQTQLDISEYELAKTENQAKRMAAYLLMPTRFLKDVLNIAYEQAVLVSDIADYFLVSEQLAHYRLKLMFMHPVDALMAFRGKIGSVEWF
ncbi:hypothetical protein J14TS2_17600 [Bacillus sp. J14TS2]|uniref:ImmA/IrrE family metallo-endopeptidase n=1 Tax=Bacillus sp. J14TS2 TaxID=2807188 RepID=UPI001B06B2D3|nr:ImmA/IrrE family metallo-endopeptidase [Bacillus sp. J14TS2]GIN71285.1 hypothetical protein J14TS2_17600 [Bacillus sp. J14TS2]